MACPPWNMPSSRMLPLKSLNYCNSPLYNDTENSKYRRAEEPFSSTEEDWCDVLLIMRSIFVGFCPDESCRLLHNIRNKIDCDASFDY